MACMNFVLAIFQLLLNHRTGLADTDVVYILPAILEKVSLCHHCPYLLLYFLIMSMSFYL